MTFYISRDKGRPMEGGDCPFDALHVWEVEPRLSVVGKA